MLDRLQRHAQQLDGYTELRYSEEEKRVRFMELLGALETLEADVEIARSLATNPAFILLDEPFAGIDPIAVRLLASLARHAVPVCSHACPLRQRSRHSALPCGPSCHSSSFLPRLGQ